MTPEQTKSAVDALRYALDASTADLADGVQGEDQIADTRDLQQTYRTEAEALEAQAQALTSDAPGLTQYANLDALAVDLDVPDILDICIYDTSRDSDGGAWRHRCQNTEWSADWGVFPAIAVILFRHTSDGLNGLRIYDATKEDLPLWQSFSEPKYFWDIKEPGDSKISLAAGQGRILIGHNYMPTSAFSGNGLYTLDFVGDEWRANTQGSGGIIRPLREAHIRPDTGGLPDIGNYNVNDVAMTVLPDAPIDPATGLAVPTIAVATDGGVSVIRHDGHVVNSEYSNTATTLDLTSEKLIWRAGSTPETLLQTDMPVEPEFPITKRYRRRDDSGGRFPKIGYSSLAPHIATTSRGFGYGYPTKEQDGGLYVVDQGIAKNFNENTGDMLTHITHEYTTGWMPGDIQGAWLGDTDPSDVSEVEIWENHLLNDASGISTNPGATASVSDKTIFFEDQNEGINASDMFIEVGTMMPGSYAFSVDIYADDLYDDRVFVHATFGDSYGYEGSNTLKSDNTPTGRWHTIAGTLNVFREASFIAFRFVNPKPGNTVALKKFSLQKSVPDHSVKGNALQIKGTVQREPVAPGAELMAYTGFSDVDYLDQPYNPDFNFGTEDFCVMWWQYDNGGGGDIVDCTSGNRRNGFWVFSGGANLRTYEDGSQASWLSKVDTATHRWQHFCWIISQSGTFGQLFVDGRLVFSGQAINSPYASINADPDRTMRVGRRQGGDEFFHGKLALLRISATAPTPEQIARIYDDERRLFEPGAACTLAGTSSKVQALAHDSGTNRLHVGTDETISIFNGLRRVDEIDQAADHIAANQGLVAYV